MGPTQQFPDLKIVLEHITTADSVAFVQSAGANTAATITPHHLRIDRNALFDGVVAARLLSACRQARLSPDGLAQAAVPAIQFFLAPILHLTREKIKKAIAVVLGFLCARGFSYALTFDEEGALDKLEGFASEFGPRFYGLPLNEGTIT